MFQGLSSTGCAQTIEPLPVVSPSVSRSPEADTNPSGGAEPTDDPSAKVSPEVPPEPQAGGEEWVEEMVGLVENEGLDPKVPVFRSSFPHSLLSTSQQMVIMRETNRSRKVRRKRKK